MPSTKIMVIRHAEKPNGEPGVYPGGVGTEQQRDESLAATGWRRAQALVGLFDPAGGAFENADLAKPQHLFASNPSIADESMRPLQTITPLAKSLGLDIDESFAKGEEEALVEKVKAIGGVALIAWQHEKIPEIAELILGADEPFPPHWPGRRFDLVWVFDREDGGNARRLAQIPQMLLPGDQADPIPFDK